MTPDPRVTAPSTPQRETLTLADGRTLSWIEAGDPDGVPLLFTIGTPSSAVGGLAFASAAAAEGVRLISIDKPGYGATSGPHPGLVGYGRDVAALADHLGLDRVALTGQSGGGPHALAAAYVLGDRVSTLTLLSSFGPATEDFARAELSGLSKVIMVLARRAPGLVPVPMSLLKLVYGKRERAAKVMARAATKGSPAEREAMSGPEAAFILDGAVDAIAHHFDAACDEFRTLGLPWGFTLEEVVAPTDLWHGTDDTSCTITLARGMAERLPNATLHELPGLGHGFFGQPLRDAMANVRAKAGV